MHGVRLARTDLERFQLLADEVTPPDLGGVQGQANGNLARRHHVHRNFIPLEDAECL